MEESRRKQAGVLQADSEVVRQARALVSGRIRRSVVGSGSMVARFNFCGIGEASSQNTV